MSGNKWRVRRYRGKWFIIPPAEWEETYEWSSAWWNTDAGCYLTWQRAMREANHRARTIEITLPADPLVWESGWDSDGRVYVRDINDNEICYEPGQLEPLALHLLAHHYRKARA